MEPIVVQGRLEENVSLLTVLAIIADKSSTLDAIVLSCKDSINSRKLLAEGFNQNRPMFQQSFAPSYTSAS